MIAVCTVKLKFLVIILSYESSVHCAQKLLMETEGRSRDQPTMEKTFAQNHFTMMDHFTMIDRSCDLSTIEKTFAQGKIMHLQSIFHYGDFTNATIRE